MGATSFANVGVGAEPADGAPGRIVDEAESEATSGMATSAARPSPTEVWMRMSGNSTVS